LISKIFYNSLIFAFISCFGNSGLHKENLLSSNLGKANYTIEFCTTRNLNGGELKESLLEQLKVIFNIDVFVETGTYRGDTALIAARHFDAVHTIELSPQLCLRARERLKDWKNIIVYEGDSADLLPIVLATSSGRVLLYLDGHFSGGITAQGPTNTPILEELKKVRDLRKSDSIILIDDIRLFQDSLFPNKFEHFSLENYPQMRQLIELILQINPSYQICFLGDALLAFPRTPLVEVSPVVAGCALHRLAPICIDCSEEDLIKADFAIANAKGDERAELELYYRTYAPFEIEYGYRSFATLWYGLILREEGREQEAFSLFKAASQNSKSDWRIAKFYP